MVERSSPPILPVLPRTPETYSVDYVNQLVRMIEAMQRYVTGINYLRGSGLYLPGLPVIGEGLVVGEVFSNGGVLTIVQEDDIWAGSLSAGFSVGTVTVVV